MSADAIRDRYRDLLGHVPETVEERLAVADAADRSEAIDAVEAWREELLHRNPLDRRTQQLVHFGMLVAMGEDVPAALHVRGAMKAGATARDLFGVAETAAVVAGMPGFTRAVSHIHAALAEADGGES